MIAQRSIWRQQSWVRFLASKAGNGTPSLFDMDPKGNAYALRVEEVGASQTRARSIELITAAMKSGAGLREIHRRIVTAQGLTREILDQEWRSYEEVVSMLGKPTQAEVAQQRVEELQQMQQRLAQMAQERERRKAEEISSARSNLAAGAALAGLAALIYLAGQNYDSGKGTDEDAGARFIREICGPAAAVGMCRP